MGKSNTRGKGPTYDAMKVGRWFARGTDNEVHRVIVHEGGRRRKAWAIKGQDGHVTDVEKRLV